MKKSTIILLIVAVLLGVGAAIVWLQPRHADTEAYSFGVSEGLQVVRDKQGNLTVEDASGNTLFPVPLRGCIVDTRYVGGRLRFRERATGREGFIDRKGIVTFYAEGTAPAPAEAGVEAIKTPDEPRERVGAVKREKATVIPQADLRTMAKGNPFYAEAAKILKGGLDENDARHRHVILNYCEHFRAAYTTKDIDFLRQVFSDEALIIVGNEVKPGVGGQDAALKSADRQVTYALHTKKDYLARLQKVFALNKRIDVRFSDFHIKRHPTRDGIYGVTLRQHYKSDRYEDDGWLFLLWDFTNPSMPTIHVRTWQPARSVGSEDDVIGIGDFNLE